MIRNFPLLGLIALPVLSFNLKAFFNYLRIKLPQKSSIYFKKLFPGLFVLFLLIMIILTGAALATFQISAWTGLFLELINKGGSSKIERVISAVQEKINKTN